jgi:hypothetical protein
MFLDFSHEFRVTTMMKMMVMMIGANLEGNVAQINAEKCKVSVLRNTSAINQSEIASFHAPVPRCSFSDTAVVHVENCPRHQGSSRHRTKLHS